GDGTAAHEPRVSEPDEEAVLFADRNRLLCTAQRGLVLAVEVLDRGAKAVCMRQAEVVLQLRRELDNTNTAPMCLVRESEQPERPRRVAQTHDRHILDGTAAMLEAV